MTSDAADRNVHLDPDLITIPQAAGRIGLHPDTLYRLTRSGQFPPGVRIGSRWRVSLRPGWNAICMARASRDRQLGAAHLPRSGGCGP